MKFSNYLKEMPHSTTMAKHVVKCPKGHIIDLHKENFFYDYASEMSGDKKWQELSDLTIGMIRGKYDIPFPVACLEHRIVFMYDFNEERGYMPSEEPLGETGYTELQMCEKLLQGLANEEKNPHLVGIKFNIYS